MKDFFKSNKICAILRGIPSEKVECYAEALYCGGIRGFEVAMNSEEGISQIRLLRRKFGKSVLVGAGTVTTKERCKEAKAAGAQFFLTPSVCRNTMEFCLQNHIPLLPGVMTPTDVSVCLEYGYEIMKLFPAGSLPLSYLKDLKGPFDGTEYVAVGGVNGENLKVFLKNGFIGAGMGSSLVPKEFIKEERWEEIERHVALLLKNI